MKIALVSLLVLISALAKGQAFTEDFDNIATLPGSGWYEQNNSSPIGVLGYFQGNSGVFSAYNGAPTAYLAVNYNSGGGTATISNWQVMPNVTLHNGDVISFWTRTESANVAPFGYPDRLQLRMSTNGASTNVGTLATDVGDFTTLLLDINSAQAQGGFPIVWTQYSVTVTGLAGPTSGRFAFRYYVTGGGPFGANSDYIGIDHVDYVPNPCNTITLSPAAPANGTAGLPYNLTFSQTGGVAPVVYTLAAGTLPPGLNLSAGGTISGTATATGTYNFDISVTDNNGCPGSQSFSITIDCNPNGAAVALSPVCSNSGMITLTGGSPVGGTYSGTGVNAGMFDPSVGTQTITYDVTDAYGCAQTASATLTVNAAPVVSLDTFSTVCADAPAQLLSGGLPLGGTYSGNSVSAGMFNPINGSQLITYTYSDANSCMDSASQMFNVVFPPSVIIAQLPELCSNSAPLTLYGGVPLGGAFSGPNVVNGVFTQTGPGVYPITYTYSIGSCGGTTTQDLTVHAASNTALAGANGITETQFTTDIPATTEVRYIPDCDLMAIVSPSGISPITGNFLVQVTLDDAVNKFQGRPYATRHYNMQSVGFAATATSTITIYAYQSEFDAYNAVASGLGMPLLPSGGVDNGNVRITEFPGQSITPNDYLGSVLITPAVNWDATNHWWEMTFPETGSGAFFIHSGVLALDVPGVSKTAGGDMNVYPNPAKDKVTVSITGTRGRNASLSVTDLTGRTLMQVPMDNDKAIIDMSSLASGMYMVIYNDDQRKETVRLTKQ